MGTPTDLESMRVLICMCLSLNSGQWLSGQHRVRRTRVVSPLASVKGKEIGVENSHPREKMPWRGRHTTLILMCPVLRCMLDRSAGGRAVQGRG